jgi:DNA-directed RNA polymerase specialized sigma24 family protein
MGSQPVPSVSQWILGAKQGDSQAIARLWQCYFERLVRLARQRLAGTLRRVADEEDVALSVFASFCSAAEAGRFPDLTDRDGLWRLLIKLTAQKAVDQARHQRRAKRGGGHVRGESALCQTDASETDEGLAQIIGDTPTPEFAVMVAEECARLLDCLNDNLRPIALAKMEDCTNQELAVKLGCSLTTVERGLRLIRKIWKEELERGETI